MSDLLAPQPAPVDTGHRPCWPLVIIDVEANRRLDAATVSLLVADMRARDTFGRERYGVPLTAHNGRDHLADAYQEALDGCVYLRAQIEEGSADSVIAGRVILAYLAAVRHAHDVRSIIALRDPEKAK